MQERSNVVPLKSEGEDDLDAPGVIRSTHSEELIIGICGPIGSGHHELADAIREKLEDFDYEIEVIKLSEIIDTLANVPKTKDRFCRVKELQSHGNDLRKKYGGNFLAAKAIEKISIDREKRKEASGDESYQSTRKCFVIDSIKHPAEYELFNLTYREQFFCFGIYAPVHVREENLKRDGMKHAQIYELVDRDSGEEIAHGQKVRDSFVECDFFLRLDSSNFELLNEQVERYLDIIFGTKVITPTLHEAAMHHAWVAAANSACLSRQVGAALVDRSGQLVSVGWNDVPKYEGGLYRSDTSRGTEDHRCMNRLGGQCFNDSEKRALATDLFKALVEAELLDEGKAFEFELAVRSTKVRGLIEFSRSIHAEMHALLSAIDSEGSRVKQGKLYTTTYPCHSCARHIVAAGITEVYYIEPYRKSLAIHLHGDSVTESETEVNKVKILPYHGVAPKRYFSLFMSDDRDRKSSDTGKLRRYNKTESKPIQARSIEAYPTLEGVVARSVKESESKGSGGDENA